MKKRISVFVVIFVMLTTLLTAAISAYELQQEYLEACPIEKNDDSYGRLKDECIVLDELGFFADEIHPSVWEDCPVFGCGLPRFQFCEGHSSWSPSSHRYGFLWLNICNYQIREGFRSIACLSDHVTATFIIYERRNHNTSCPRQDAVLSCCP